jgi:hypothetical protein
MIFVRSSFAALAIAASPLAMPQAYAQAQGPIVAVVDTGVDLTHREFAGRMLPGACFSWTSCPMSVLTGDDDNNHGSHVAGIIGSAADGVGNTGVAPFVRILPVKVLNAAGSGDMSSIARGIDFARTNQARVINLSLGGASGSTSLLTSLRAAKTNSVIVAAAGNQGNNFRPLWPAAYATDSQIVGSMLIVGSVGANNVISRFSNTPGTGGCVTTNRVAQCWRDFFVVAPGENILSAGKDGNYVRMSGTSMATPFVAGAAALVLQQSPFLTPAQVVDILKRSATDLGARGVDNVYGWGLVNPTRAVSPLGTTRIATSGGMTLGFAGTASIEGSSLRAPWAGPVLRSRAAQNAVMFDAYGRDFDAQLDARGASHGVSAFAAAAQIPASWEAKSYATEGASMYAVLSGQETNAVAALSMGPPNEEGYSHFVATVRLAPDWEASMGHRAPVAGAFNTLDLAAGTAQDQMFLGVAALNSPYASLAEGGAFGGLSWRAGDDWRVSAAFTSSRREGGPTHWDPAPQLNPDDQNSLAPQTHMRSAEAFLAAAEYRVDDAFSIGATATLTDERKGLLGSEEAGAWALTAQAQTLSLGLQARLGLGEGWSASAAWSMGRSSVTAEATGLASDVSAVTSQAYGLALTKQGVFGAQDSFGVAVSRPLHVTEGAATITASTGVTEAREIVYIRERVDLSASAPETQIEAGYSAAFGETTRISVSALYQDNADAIEGKTSIGAIVRFRAEF